MDWCTDDMKNSASKKTRTEWNRLCPRKEEEPKGYIDFTSNKVFGTLRSCAQDAIINIARIFNIDIKDKIFTSFPPKEDENTPWDPILKSTIVTKHFRTEQLRFEGGKAVLRHGF